MIFTLSLEQQQRLLASAHKRFQEVLTHLREQGLDRGDTGACISLHTETEVGRLLQAAFRVGSIPSAARGKEIGKNVAEKSFRLHTHADHVSSWQSRDLQRCKYGGAIRVAIREPGGGRVAAIMSSSGIIEHGDETLLMLIATDLGWEYNRLGILYASGNKLYHEFAC